MITKLVKALLAAGIALLATALPHTPASADGVAAGTDIQVAQTLGDRELTVIIRRVDNPPAPIWVDVVTHAGTPAGELELRASTAGETISTATVELGATPGFYAATLRADRAGPWELALDDGTQVATIPFVIPANVSSPWENATYGGFVAAGVLLIIALGAAVFGRNRLALIPAGGMVAALAVAITAAILAPMVPVPPAPGTQLDPTFDNVGDPYQRTSIVNTSRPPVNLAATMDGDDLRLQLTDGATGRPVDDLQVHHNAFLHLVVVSPSGDMAHLHPIRTASGEYRTRLETSETGLHAIAVELSRRGGGVQLVRSSVQISTATSTPAPPGEADLDEEIGTAGTPSTITANFGSADLQPWLGMLGHMIVVGPVDEAGSEAQGAVDAPIWAHVHAMAPKATGVPNLPDESVAAYGPDVAFTYTFPLPGRYLVWVQVQRDYTVITVPTVIDVTVAKGPQG